MINATALRLVSAENMNVVCLVGMAKDGAY